MKHTCKHRIDQDLERVVDKVLDLEVETYCGQPAVCVIKTKEGKISQEIPGDKMGRGVASQWVPICQMHKALYPDYDGMDL